MNERPGPKALQVAFHRHFGRVWMGACLSNLLRVDGLEKVKALDPPRGVLLCSNHRSFFDQYVISYVLVEHVPWVRRLYFPVRSNFFYESWTGVAINFLVGGYAMYPPIFRDAARSDLNKFALEKAAEFLREKGSVVGIHPEGTRGKGPDPYELLRAQPGVGQVAIRARPTILPVWINGLSNDFLEQVASNFRRGERRGAPVIVVFGDPVDLGPLYDENPRPAVYKRAADRILEDIRRLGEREREIRARVAPGHKNP